MSDQNPTDTPRRGRWKTPMLAALGVANVALLASLLGFDGASTADAQNAGRPSEYLMIPASLTNLNQDIVYIVDTNSGALTAAVYDRNNGLRFLEVPLSPNEVFGNAR